MAVAECFTLEEFQAKFNNEESCRTFLFKNRFPDGFVCPKCGAKEYVYMEKRHIFQCKHCRHQTSVTSGTIMHRTHLPLVKWFWAIYLCATDKRGISAVELSRQLQISYESAWYLLKRIRKAMGERDANYKLFGLVETDDSYLGGPKTGGKPGRGTTKKIMLVGLSKDSFGNPKYLHLQLAPDVTRETLQSFIDKHIVPGSTIECDGFTSYAGLTGVKVMSKAYKTGYLKWLHKAISNFKTFLLGTYHGRCRDYQAYMDEFCFRYNRRNSPMALFSRLTRAVATSCAC
jgi:transposase-like protein